jgi:xylan 1,4-beta-xylosidase
MHIRKLLFVFIFLAFPAGALPWSGGYGDPLVLPNGPDAADPAVIHVDGRYYLYPTTDKLRVECWSSADLSEWIYEGVVWGPSPEGSWNDAKVWAPDVFHYNDQFYLYYTANNKIGVAVADDPTGPFIDFFDQPFIGSGFGGSLMPAIDAHVFLDDDGRLYMYCTGYIPFSSIRVREMSDPLTLVGDWQYLISPKITSWEMFINEGPWMLKHEDIYYLMYSGSGANLPTYALGYATADNPMGPFVKFEGNPILSLDWDNEIYGPGHNSVARGVDGELLMFYHTKTDAGIGWDREIRINPIAFNDDGRIYVVGNQTDADSLNDDDDLIDLDNDYRTIDATDDQFEGACG